eukprot:3035280-Alexandrium_andersonii.AAC.1
MHFARAKPEVHLNMLFRCGFGFGLQARVSLASALAARGSSLGKVSARRPPRAPGGRQDIRDAG